MKLKKQTLLWEISNSKFDKKSYLFGTMHVKSEKVFSAFGQIAEYIDSCEAFCVEVDLDEAQSPNMQKELILPPGTSLSTLLKPKELKRLAFIFKTLGGPPMQHIQHLRPMNLINLMSSMVMKEETKTILDMHLYQYAKNNDKRTFGIETLEEHIDILTNMDLKTEVKQLKSIIRNFSSFVKQHSKIMDYYTHGRIDKLYHNGKKSLGKWRKMLLLDRNAKMAERLHNLASEESIFCAIGAGHLYGKHGVICLLKQHGALLKPIPLKYS